MEFTTGALGTLLPKLGQLLQGEYNLHKGAKRDIELLSWELESTRAALRKVGNMPPEQLDERVRIWAREAREVSYDMEDIVDTFLVSVQGPDERPSKRSAKSFIKDMRNFVTKAKPRHDIGLEIKDIKERLKEVAERRDRYKVEATSAKTFVDPRITSLYTKAADLIAVDELREELITRLTKGDDTSVPEQRIATIVGFGGLGKTTLAKAVYDKLKGQFNCTAFVSIGRNPDFQKVFKDILINLDEQQGKGFNLAIFDETKLIQKLRSFLENKRYFIVIDDVWEIESWEIIKLALIDNSGSSRIIVTTRNYEVARKAGDVYELQPLSYDNSRKLLFGRIFGGESKTADDQRDDEVFDKILKECGGIPLAIITMASLLLDKPREDWSEVHHSIGFGHNEGNTQVESTRKILSFSYYELPPHLRACLLYLCVFPKDHFIEKTPLIWMWIAEGFVQEELGIASFEMGERYFYMLVNRSMIRLEESGLNDGMVCGCRVHGMVLDFIRSISFEENFITRFLLDGNKVRASSSSSRPGQGKVRRLALQGDGTVETHMEDMKQLRSFISHGCDIGGKGGVLLSSFKLVRVLAIHTFSSQCITRQHLKPIQNLLHLRCLQLSSGYVDLPEKEIATLKFLWTLDVKMVDPEEMVVSVGLLTQLRCLRIRNPLARIPDGIGKLTFLEELEIYHSSGYSEQEASWRVFINELGGLRELRVLCVRMPLSLEHAQTRIHMVQSLRNLHKLVHLSLSVWPPQDPETTWDAAEAAVVFSTGYRSGSLLLPRCLRRLFLPTLMFSRFPSFFLNASRLPKLSHLSLSVDHLDAQDLRILGKLPELHYLYLFVKSTVQLVCTRATDDARLFQKLRNCTLYWLEGVRLLSSKEDSGGVSIRMASLYGSMLLGSGRDKDVAPTLLPSVQELHFSLRAQDFKDSDCRLGLKYFASLQNVRVSIIRWDGSSDAEARQVEAALRREADDHPNRPWWSS